MLVSASGMDSSYIFTIGIPSIVGGFMFGAMLAYVCYEIICMMQINARTDVGKKRAWIKKGSVVTSIISVCLTVVYLFNVMPFFEFFIYQVSASSSFISDNYVDPKTTNISFPEQKRNLIYIYMESMENTFAGEENGGGFKENMTPEMVSLINENISFSNTDKIGGALKTYGMTYTTAGFVSTLFGLPLKVGEKASSLKSDAIMPNLYNLFDVLDDAGYNQYVVMGSSADFGGLKQLFNSHGNANLWDYNYMIESEYIPSTYRVFWGVEDAKMYDFSKQKLNEVSQYEEPFIFVLETVDTHSPNGWVCNECQNNFDSQYCNVIACASRQLKNFIEWAKVQKWYENTTIVVVGDHLSMKNDFFVSLDSNYVRTTTNIIINPDDSLDYSNTIFTNREFCTIDMFPTVLSAIGCKIEGERLGLGTNLFSNKKTLFEEHGFEKVNEEFKKKSSFYNNVFN